MLNSSVENMIILDFVIFILNLIIIAIVSQIIYSLLNTKKNIDKLSDRLEKIQENVYMFSDRLENIEMKVLKTIGYENSFYFSFEKTKVERLTKIFQSVAENLDIGAIEHARVIRMKKSPSSIDVAILFDLLPSLKLFLNELIMFFTLENEDFDNFYKKIERKLIESMEGDKDKYDILRKKSKGLAIMVFRIFEGIFLNEIGSARIDHEYISKDNISKKGKEVIVMREENFEKLIKY